MNNDNENLNYKGTFATEIALGAGNSKPHTGTKKPIKGFRLPKLATNKKPIAIANANEYLHFLKDAKTNSWSLSWAQGLREIALRKIPSEYPFCACCSVQ